MCLLLFFEFHISNDAKTFDMESKKGAGSIGIMYANKPKE